MAEEGGTKYRMRGIYVIIFLMNLKNAKKLRKNMTEFEVKLWKHLRDRRFCNAKFRRQVPISNYIADFVCFEKRIIIELDGSGHVDDKQDLYDRKRDLFFESKGYKVLRFWNSDISNNIEKVMDVIYKSLE